ncbi:DUF2855 family protein [Litorimonas sp.]|uniref:DUF2855 family protein n=1 Tax=Litorimonas sp. TaxID=1892381 RepID=UPI003A8C1951
MTQTLLVNKSDFSDVSVITLDAAPLADGFIRCQVGPWALTANNVTYMVTGDRIGYWNYFRPDAYGIHIESHGRTPVWGFAEIVESQCEGVSAGQKIYGFFPIVDQFDIKPVDISPMGFQDGNDHRKKLHSLYNRYTFTDADPSFDLHQDLQPILRPLFTTSFLIDDFLAEKNYFEAEQILILSASSKTALGTAFCAKQRGAVKVAGLTSEGNKDFTKGTGFYDKVETYDTITDLNPDIKTVVVDMSGNGKVLATVSDHFEENLKYVCKVGLSHWDAASEPAPKPSAPTEFFFAPDQAKTRIAEWGGAGFAQKLGERWRPFLESASHWLTVGKSSDVTELLNTYKDVLNGEASPDKGFLFSL